MSEQQWRDHWNTARLFFTADGESGKACGNETIRIDADGRLRIKVSAALAGQLGSHVAIGQRIRFNHRRDEWEQRASGRLAMRYDISFDPVAIGIPDASVKVGRYLSEILSGGGQMRVPGARRAAARRQTRAEGLEISDQQAHMLDV